MDLNTKIFAKINSLIGRNKFLDLFGLAGAEWVIVAMVGWYVTSSLITYPDLKKAIWLIIFLGAAWCLGWIINLLLGVTVLEPRPYISDAEFKSLIKPYMSWKSFPSDHSMSAFVIFFMALFLNLPGALALLPLAIWVVWGRVYAGLHYPLDMVGGLAVAVFSSSLITYFLAKSI